MTSVHNYFTDDRRRRTDRRSSDLIAQFPIITTQGVCVRRDRRHTPERRVSSIEVKEWDVKESIFDLLFQQTDIQNKH
ncbi:MAG: hypothetical protein ACR2PU_04275 [Gammaproteobacteria bacterium]